MPTLQTRSLFFTGPRLVEVRPDTIEPPGPGEVLVETRVSGISAGTEMNVYRGLAPQWRKRRDPETGLFVETDDPDWSYPTKYGYASVGHVRDVGPGVSGLSAGDLVFAYAPHARTTVVAADAVVPLGDIDPETATFFANLSTAYNGVLDAWPPLGATVVVSGLGVIGQLVVRLLRRTGPEHLIVVDPVSSRRELAVAAGATLALDPSTESAAAKVRQLTRGRGADIVVEVSGAAPALNEAIRTVGYNGLVVAMSWFGGSFESLDLSGEFHHNRPRIVSSQVAALNPMLGPLWTMQRRTRRVRELLVDLDLDALISHRIPFERASDAYDLIDGQTDDVMHVLLAYGDDA